MARRIHSLGRLRRWLLAVPVLLLAALAAASLSGCAQSGAAGPTEIVYWTGWSGHELEVLQKLVDEFNRENAGKIHVRMISVFNSTGSYQKVRIAFAGGSTPDVCSAVWSAELAGYAMRGALTPLDDFLKKSGRRPDEWIPGVWDMGRYHGKTWGLTGTTNGNFVVYNKAIFEKEGLKPPTTLAEFDKVNQALIIRDAKGSYKQYGMRPASLEQWAYIFGGHWYEPETGRITATDPHNVQALTYLQSFAKRNDVRRMEVFESTFGSNETPSGPFFTGKQAMMATGPWIAEFIRRYAPADFRYGYFANPAPPTGRKDCTALGSSVFVIPAGSKHKQEAWTFLNWLMLPAQNLRFCYAIGNNSPLKAVAAEPEMNKEPLLEFSAKIAGGKNAFGPPQMPIWPTYQIAIQRAEDQAIHGMGDPKTLLEDVQFKMEKEMKRVEKEAVY